MEKSAATALPLYESKQDSLDQRFWILYRGRTISALGDQASLAGAALWVAYFANSGLYMSLLQVIPMIVGILIASPIGTLVDRSSSKRRVLMGADLLSGLSALLLAGLLFFPKFSNQTVFVALVIVRCLSIVSNSFFASAFRVLVLGIIRKEQIVRVNSLLETSTNSASLLGEVFGAVLFRWVGGPFLFLLDALSFFVSLFSVSQVEETAEKSRESTTKKAAPTGSFVQDLKDGFRFLIKTEGFTAVLFIAICINFVFTPISTLLPFVVKDGAMGIQWFGFFLAAFSAGTIGSSALFVRLSLHTPQRKLNALVAAFVSLALATLTLGLQRNPYCILLMMFIVGFSQSPINIIIMSALQSKTPEAMLGRVMGSITTLFHFFSPIGILVAGLYVDYVRLDVGFYFLALSLVSFFVAMFTYSNRKVLKLIS